TNLAAYTDWLLEQTGRPGGVGLLESALRGVSQLPVVRWADNPPSELVAARLATTFRKRPRSHADPTKSVIEVYEHLGQMGLHAERFGKSDFYHRWYLFDDAWVAAHPNLASSLLRSVTRWDVL